MTALLRQLELQQSNRSAEYLEEASYVREHYLRSLIRPHFKEINITRTSVVHNNYLRAMYELKKEEYESRYGSVREKLMFHATSEFHVDSIIMDNLDWRRVSRNKYGIGVSFSEDADYANYHSNRCNGERRAFIVANILVSNMTEGSSLMTYPPETKDTALGNNMKVYVKFSDHEFLPLYVVYYDAPDRSESKHHRVFTRRFRLW